MVRPNRTKAASNGLKTLTSVELTRVRLRQSPEGRRVRPSRGSVVARSARVRTWLRDCRSRRYRPFRHVRVPATGLRDHRSLGARSRCLCSRHRRRVREPATFGRRLGNHRTRRCCDRSAVTAVNRGATGIRRANARVALRAISAGTIIPTGLSRPDCWSRLGNAGSQQGHCQHRCQEISSVHFTPPPNKGAAAPLAHKSKRKCSAGAGNGIFENSAQRQAGLRDHRHARVRMS